MKFQIEVIKSKIHRVTVTQADLNYVGSITIDEALMEADRKSTRLNSSHNRESRMPSSA